GNEFVAFLLQDENLTPYVEGSLGRWYPVTKAAAERPFWKADRHRTAVYNQFHDGTVTFEFTKNYKFTIINNENVWAKAMNRIVDRLVHGHLFADDSIHRLRPHILVIDDRELVVLGEFEGHRPGVELVVYGGAVPVGLPERALGSGFGHRVPATERALDVRRQVLVLQQERDEFLRTLLVLCTLEDHAGLDRRAIDHLRAVGLVREA